MPSRGVGWAIIADVAGESNEWREARVKRAERSAAGWAERNGSIVRSPDAANAARLSQLKSLERGCREISHRCLASAPADLSASARLGMKRCHGLDLPLGNRTPDSVINELSLREGYVFVTKDAGFVSSFLLRQRSYKLLLACLRGIWLRNFADDSIIGEG